mgnify:CR=1 FL=1
MNDRKQWQVIARIFVTDCLIQLDGKSHSESVFGELLNFFLRECRGSFKYCPKGKTIDIKIVFALEFFASRLELSDFQNSRKSR